MYFGDTTTESGLERAGSPFQSFISAWRSINALTPATEKPTTVAGRLAIVAEELNSVWTVEQRASPSIPLNVAPAKASSKSAAERASLVMRPALASHLAA